MIGARALSVCAAAAAGEKLLSPRLFPLIAHQSISPKRDRINTICTHRQMSLMVEKSCRDAIRKGREEKAMNRRLTEWQELNVHDEISESALHRWFSEADYKDVSACDWSPPTWGRGDESYIRTELFLNLPYHILIFILIHIRIHCVL